MTLTKLATTLVEVFVLSILCGDAEGAPKRYRRD